ncbi:MAG: hypothetical protein K8U03_09635 [Planctomycetia bacterium]|nr:hypothetical protein [Planctomycetia bacterium]
MSPASVRRLPRASAFVRLALPFFLVAALFSAANAQEPAKPDTPKVDVPKPDAPKSDAPKADPVKKDLPKESPAKEVPPKEPAPKEQTLKEQTIYIPYTKLREIFETEKRGVFLPYDKFQELWRAARENQPVVPDVKPPVATLISEVLNEAVVSRDVVKVSAKIKLEILGTGWHSVSLRLRDAAITSAKLDGKPARILFDKETGYRLVVERAKDGPQQFELLLEYAKTFLKLPGTNTVSFESPQAPVSRWQVRLDEPGVKIDIHPLIAASDVPPTDPKQPRSEILAFVGAAETVKIDWTPRAEGATGLDVLAGVQTEEQVTIDETATHTRATLVYTISRASLAQLRIDVPANQRVANVFEANVRRWSIEKPAAPNAATQRILVELFEPAKQTQSIVVELEQITEEAAMRTSVVPIISAVDVGRQQGIVVVQVAEGLRAEAEKRSGLLQLDAADLPGSLARGRWAFSYRYATVPFDLALKIEKVQPRITSEILVEANLQPDKLALNVKAKLMIEKAGIFQLALEVPAGFEINEATGFRAEGVEPLAIDGFRVEGADRNSVVFNLTRKAIGRVGLNVQLSKALNDPELKTPLGREAALEFSLPRFTASTVERTSGRLVVYAPESLRVNPGEAKGLRSVSFQEALAGMEQLRAANPSNARPVQAFSFADAPAKLVLAVERRKPQVTVRQLLTAKIEPGVVKYQASFHYDILYSAVRSLRIDIPEKIVGSVHNDTPGVRESVITPPPADLAAGYVAWSLAGESEFIGNFTLKLSWETPVEKLDVGSSVEIVVPHLMPRLVDRAWGQIVLVKAEAIDLREAGEPRALRPIDPQHDLMPGAAVVGAARAFEFHEDWNLAVTATRYKLEELKRTSIERAVVRAVVTRSRQTSVQALYQLRSARQRLALQLPAGVTFDTEPLRINGKSVTLESGKQGEYFIPLAGQNPDTPIVLELRYTLLDQGTTFDLPTFPEDPAIQRVYLCAYLPEEWAVPRAEGPWTDEISWVWGRADWRYSGGRGFVPYPNKTDGELVAWVTQNVAMQGKPLDNFQHDGRLLVFSVLHPEPPPAGSLRLATIHRTLLNGLVLLVIIGGGLLLVRSRAALRAAAVGLAIVGLVLARVFQPMLIYELVNGIFIWSVVIVGVIWIVAWIMRRASGQAVPVSRPTPPAKPKTEPKTVVNLAPASSDVAPPAPVPAAEPVVEFHPVTPPVTPPIDPDEPNPPNAPESGKSDPPDWAAPGGKGHE